MLCNREAFLPGERQSRSFFVILGQATGYPGLKTVILDLSTSPSIDFSGRMFECTAPGTCEPTRGPKPAGSARGPTGSIAHRRTAAARHRNPTENRSSG